MYEVNKNKLYPAITESDFFNQDFAQIWKLLMNKNGGIIGTYQPVLVFKDAQTLTLDQTLQVNGVNVPDGLYAICLNSALIKLSDAIVQDDLNYRVTGNGLSFITFLNRNWTIGARTLNFGHSTAFNNDGVTYNYSILNNIIHILPITNSVVSMEFFVNLSTFNNAIDVSNCCFSFEKVG